MITEDTFDIAKRLKQIDNNYILKFNLHKKQYEVFYKESDKHILQLVLPFKELDKRTIDYVNKTRVQNIEKLIKNIQKQNEKLEKDAQNKVQDQAKTQLSQMGKYIHRKADNYNINFENSYKTKWV
jgi:MFS superfamily sulfate permease-like transporter